MTQQIPLLVIGAGPFGLAVAAYARRCGIEAVIAGRPMAFWQSNMPAGMFLRSGIDWHLDAGGDWTIARFLAERGVAEQSVRPFPLRTYLDYAEWFSRQAQLDIRDGIVQRLVPAGDRGFVATLDDDRCLTATNVVVAVGFQYFVNVPAELEARLPAGAFEHTCTAVDLAALAGRRCLIVGGRQSAFEWAALAADAGAAKVDVAYRHDTPQFAESHWEWAGALVERFVDEPGWYRRQSPQEREALAFRFWSEGRLKLEPWLLPRLKPEVVTMRPRSEIRSAARDGGAIRVVFDDGDAISVDRLVLATGYKPSLARVPFLDAALRDAIETRNGSPVLDDTMQASVPGLYFTSMLATDAFGPFFAFTVSARAAARLIASGIRAG